MTDKTSRKRDNLVIGFFRQVREELKHVTWPTRQEVIRLTAMVIAVTVIAGLYLGGLDYVFTQLMGLIL